MVQKNLISGHTWTRLRFGTEHLSCPKTYSFPYVELICLDHDRSKVPNRGRVYPGAIAGNRDKKKTPKGKERGYAEIAGQMGSSILSGVAAQTRRKVGIVRHIFCNL